jgi:DNA-binding response OmpR family regulator
MRVLVAEDERKIASYVKRGLEEEGYAVDLAFTGGGKRFIGLNRFYLI